MKPKYSLIAKIVAVVLVATVVVWFSIKKSNDRKQQPDESAPAVQDAVVPESENAGENVSSETIESQIIDTDAPAEFQILVGDYELICEGMMPETVKYKTRGNANIACDVEFYVVVEDKEIPVFSMNLQDNRGDITTICTDEKGASMSVAFTMYALPENLEESKVQAFYTAQDFVNTLAASMKTKTIYDLQKDTPDQVQTYTVGGVEISFGELNLKDIQIRAEE